MVIAAATTAGEIIVGIVSLLIVIGLLVVGVRVVIIALRLLWRLVTWPFRALRPKPPTGAGADYEAMIRQQPRTAPADYERPRPFPPHPDQGQSSNPPYWPPPPPGQQSPPAWQPMPDRQDAAVCRYRKGWSWTVSIIVTLLPIGAILAIAQAIWGMHAQDLAGYIGYGLAAVYWLWSWRRRGRVPIIRIGSQVPGERAEFEAWRAAKHDEDLAEFQTWKAERSQVADGQTAPESKPSIDTF